MQGSLYEEAYTWSNTSVKEKVGLSVGAYTRGGLIGGEIWYCNISQCKCTIFCDIAR